MIDIRVSAPGKIVLCGEYVVLDGASALGVALNRRALVKIHENSASHHRVTSPGYADGTFSFTVNKQSEFVWKQDAAVIPDFSLLEQIWRASGVSPSTMLDLVLDTQPFVDSTGSHKLGLGSSAALTVGLSAALAGLQQQGVDLDAMITAHRQFQNGRGSGIDIATVQCGGVVEYRMGSTAQVRSHTWPSGLEYTILWSGTAASTSRQLERFGASADHPESRERLAIASTNIVTAWPAADAEQIVDLFAGYTVALGEFNAAHDLGIFNAGHAELVILAGKHGAVYKPCGAGGGDVGIVLSTNTLSIKGFVNDAMAMGFQPLDLRIDDVGLALDAAEEPEKK